MRIDTLEFVALADQRIGLPFSRQTHSLSGAMDIVTPIDPATGYGQWKHIKHPQGWPWDLKLYDNQFIYDWITEKDWESGPRAYKKFIQNHANPAKHVYEDGMVQLPRWVDSGGSTFNEPIPATLTHYATFVDCKQQGPAVSLGPVHQSLRGPFTIDHGGDVGIQPTVIHQYHWTEATEPRMEENHYALNYGWVRWQLLEISPDGIWTPLQTTVSNQLAPATVQIQFPCF